MEKIVKMFASLLASVKDADFAEYYNGKNGVLNMDVEVAKRIAAKFDFVAKNGSDAEKNSLQLVYCSFLQSKGIFVSWEQRVLTGENILFNIGKLGTTLFFKPVCKNGYYSYKLINSPSFCDPEDIVRNYNNLLSFIVYMVTNLRTPTIQTVTVYREKYSVLACSKKQGKTMAKQLLMFA